MDQFAPCRLWTLIRLGRTCPSRCRNCRISSERLLLKDQCGLPARAHTSCQRRCFLPRNRMCSHRELDESAGEDSEVMRWVSCSFSMKAEARRSAATAAPPVVLKSESKQIRIVWKSRFPKACYLRLMQNRPFRKLGFSITSGKTAARSRRRGVGSRWDRWANRVANLGFVSSFPINHESSISNCENPFLLSR